jgi:predicted HTH domain antitoxin
MKKISNKENTLQQKIIQNQIIDTFKKQELNPFEKSILLNQYVNNQRKTCPTCGPNYNTLNKKHSGKNVWCEQCSKIISKLSEEINVSKTTLYETLRLKNVNEKTLQKIKENKISINKAARLIGKLSDKNLPMENELINEIINNDLDTEEITQLTQQINNNKTNMNYPLIHLTKANKHIKIAIKQLDKKQKEKDQKTPMHEGLQIIHEIINDNINILKNNDKKTIPEDAPYCGAQ